MSTNLYAVLGVDRTAKQEEIKRAYRSIAREFHPDKNPGDHDAETKFKAAAEAYQVLGDRELRAEYDRSTRRSGPRSSTSEVFDEFFGTRSKRSRSRSRRRRGGGERGNDLRYTLDLEFEEAALGTEKRILVPRKERCDTCAGTGAQPGSVAVICQSCSGTGTARSQGFLSGSSTCTHCNGAGKIISESCRACSGEAVVPVERAISVKVPSGVDTGTRLKISGEGQRGTKGGESGDLFVIVSVKPHPLFERDEDDVLTEVPIAFTDAALGAQVEVPTLDGKVRMRIPPGSQTGRVFRLKGKGIPALEGRGRGDHRVCVVVETPTDLGRTQRALLEELAELDEQSESPRVQEYRRALRKLYGGD